MNRILIGLLTLSTFIATTAPVFADTNIELGNFNFGGSGNGGSDFGGSGKLSGKKIRRMLGMYGLQHSECLPNSVAIVYGRKNKTVCAYPTAKFPGGYYSLHPETRRLSRIDGGDTQNPGGSVGSGNPGGYYQYPVAQPQYNPYPGGPVGSGNPGGYNQYPAGQPGFNRYPGGQGGYTINQASVPSAPLPSILGENGAPVPENTSLHIKQILAKKNIQLTSCSNSPIALFRISHYTACAIGSPQFPAGRRFAVDASLPF